MRFIDNSCLKIISAKIRQFNSVQPIILYLGRLSLFYSFRPICTFIRGMARKCIITEHSRSNKSARRDLRVVPGRAARLERSSRSEPAALESNCGTTAAWTPADRTPAAWTSPADWTLKGSTSAVWTLPAD